MIDEFGDRMKGYEAEFVPLVSGILPIYMRLDGHGFSKVSKKLKLTKPRDERMERLFQIATKETMQEFHLQFGFTQSDEVSLFFPILENDVSELPFGGKVRKLLSVIASFFTSSWIRNFKEIFGELDFNVAFDARLVEFPSKSEAVNMLIWRWKDAERNYVSDLSLTMFSPKELHKVPFSQRVEMIGGYDANLVGQFIRPYQAHITGHDGQDIIRNRYLTSNPEKGFKNCSFDERMEFVYDKMELSISETFDEI